MDWPGCRTTGFSTTLGVRATPVVSGSFPSVQVPLGSVLLMHTFISLSRAADATELPCVSPSWNAAVVTGMLPELWTLMRFWSVSNVDPTGPNEGRVTVRPFEDTVPLELVT